MTSTLGLFITLACFSTIFGHREEPINSCTRIDFEEKMLMKMVTLQVTVETTLSSINAKLEEFSAEKAKLMKDIETFKVDLKEELGAFKVDLKEELTAFKVAADDVMKQQTTQQEQFIKEMSSKYDTMLSQTDGMVQRIQADVQNATQELQVDLNKELGAFKVDQKEEMGTFKVAADDVMKQQMTQQEQFIKEMSSKYDTMVSNTDGMVQRIQADILNATQELEERIVQDPVAFIARFSSGFNPVAGNTFIFDTIVQNVGGGYGATDGMFTAPVAGAYVLSAQVCIQNGYYIDFHIRSKDRVYSMSRHGEQDFGAVCSSVSTVAVLTAGEKVWVLCKYIRSGGFLYSDGSRWTMFSGALVQPAV